MPEHENDTHLRRLFDLEQAWWRRQQAWSAVQSAKPGPYRRELWQRWLTACHATDDMANLAAGDATGQWRNVFYDERRNAK